MSGRDAIRGRIARVMVSTAIAEFIVETTAEGLRSVTPDGWARSGRVRDVAAAAHLGRDRRSEARRTWPQVGDRSETLPGSANSPAGHDAALGHARAAADALRRYGLGERLRYRGPLDVAAPALHLAVWDRLRAVPFGETITYGAIAAALGTPGEARAVGVAIGANPVCILVPCHRVVGADGSLRGFAWGLDLKRRLLAHEGCGALEMFAGTG